MKKRLQQLICKYGVQLCAVAMAISPLISHGCKGRIYSAQQRICFPCCALVGGDFFEIHY